MAPGYYQFGGFQPHIQWYRYDDKALAQGIVGDKSPLRSHTEDCKGPVELALGIKTSGTSHLLLTDYQTREYAKCMGFPPPRTNPLPPTEFESISPIYFHTPDQLVKKLGTLKTKSHKGRVPMDNSQANKQYYSATREEGIQRGLFEHGRLLYLSLQNRINPQTYGANDTSWTSSIQIFSFVFNPRLADHRNSRERLMNPIILDYGLSEATIPDLSLKDGSSKHFILAENRFLSQGKPHDFKHGTTEVLDRSVLFSRLQEFFETKTRPGSRPVVLLVHGEEITRNVLKKCGVDSSDWESGTKGLLGFESKIKIKTEPGPSRLNDPRRRPTADPRSSRDDYSQRRDRPRSRSRSPQRGPSGASASSQHNSRRTPPRSYSVSSGYSISGGRNYAPIYIVDIQKLYVKLMQTEFASGSIAKMYQHLGLGKVDGWCAGNESRYILEIWRSMVSGPSIDEQKALRAAINASPSRTSPSKAESANPDLEGSDDERDPNDIVQIPSTIPGNIFDADSDSDYGQSDSD